VRAVYADLDAKSDEGISALVRRVEAFPLPPSVLVASGGGLHPYWLLEEPLDLTTLEILARFECVLRGVAGMLHADLAAAEAARVLRPPGTLNLPNVQKQAKGRAVARVRILKTNGTVYSFEDFDAFEIRGRSVSSEASGARAKGERVREGGRHLFLLSLAATLRRRGLTEVALVASLHAVNHEQCEPPLGDKEVDAIARWAGSKDGDRPYTGEEEAGLAYHLTDLGNARRFVAHHIRDFRYVPQWCEWITYTGRRWQRDTTGEVVRRAKETSLSIYQEAFARPNQDERSDYCKHAVRSESARSISAMLELAKTEPGIPVEPHHLDADPMLLNVLNGTLDLRNGILRPHDRGDLITRLAPVNFDPGASLALFDEYLKTVVPDEEQRGFLKRCAGYSLTGDTSEERLLFIYGPEASGKSTFIETLKASLGDYAATADFETFLARRDVGGPRPDLARLAGARFVSSIEVEDGKRLAEGLVKLLTGGDTITVRELYQRAFEFKPQFTLWLAANDEPRVRDDDGAIWRRILQIPFTVSIPEEDRDPQIKATLRDPAAAGPAVLAWAVQGCLEWQRIGLAPPKLILEATRAYRERMDPISDFLEEECETGTGFYVTTAALFAAYLQWCKASAGRPLSKRGFGLRLAAKGFDGVRDKRERGWLGIRLRQEVTLGDA
jgi:putative DNA primase/helicase